MNKYLTLLILTLLLLSCSVSNTNIKKLELTTFEGLKGPSIDLLDEYRISPGDILDIIYHVKLIKIKNYQLQIQDLLEIKFLNAPELDQEQRVRPDGNISLPYLGDIQVIGKTPSELTQELKEKYESIFQHPEILVIVKEFGVKIEELKKAITTSARGQSKLITVRPDGYATFPLIGDIKLAGKTIPEASQILNKSYHKVLKELQVSLLLHEPSGSMIYVVGEVKKPGAYKIMRPITVVEALSLAEGFTRDACLKSVIVARKKEKTMYCQRINLDNVLKLKEEAKFFYVLPNDIIYVPRTWISKAAQVADYLSSITFFRGFYIGYYWELHKAR